MKFIREENRTVAPQNPPTSLSNHMLAMIFEAQFSTYTDRSCPKEEFESPTRRLPAEAGFGSELTKSTQNKAIRNICKNHTKSSYVQRLRKKDDDFRASPIDAKMQLVLVRKRGTKVGSGRSWLRRPQASIPLASTAVTTMRTWYPRRLRLRNRSCSNAE